MSVRRLLPLIVVALVLFAGVAPAQEEPDGQDPNTPPAPPATAVDGDPEAVAVVTGALEAHEKLEALAAVVDRTDTLPDGTETTARIRFVVQPPDRMVIHETRTLAGESVSVVRAADGGTGVLAHKGRKQFTAVEPPVETWLRGLEHLPSVALLRGADISGLQAVHSEWTPAWTASLLPDGEIRGRKVRVVRLVADDGPLGGTVEVIAHVDAETGMLHRTERIVNVVRPGAAPTQWVRVEDVSDHDTSVPAADVFAWRAPPDFEEVAHLDLRKPVPKDGDELLGKPAVDFTLNDMDRQAVSLRDYRGKVVILNFWATWCAPCKQEIPHFIELQDAFGESGLRVVGVSNEERALIREFAEENALNYDLLVNPGGLPEPYGSIESIPTTFVIDREGRVRAFVVGYREMDFWRNWVETLIRED